MDVSGFARFKKHFLAVFVDNGGMGGGGCEEREFF